MAIQRETKLIVKPFKDLLIYRGWVVKNFHGNQFQEGVPDAYICHMSYTPRWVEFKVVDEYGKIHLTPAQKKLFPVWQSLGVPIYIIAAKDLRGSDNQLLRERLYKKLFEEPNVIYAFSERLYQFLY